MGSTKLSTTVMQFCQLHFFVFFTTVGILLLQSCGGKVADLSAGSASATQVSIITENLGTIAVGTVSTAVSTTGGTPPLVFKLIGGSFPSGLSMDANTGAITGTVPASAANQNYAVTIGVVDSAGLTSTKTFSGTVSSGGAVLTIYSTTIATITAGVAYSYPLAVVGGSTPYKFSITNGVMPAGLSIDSTSGTISGTPASTLSNQSYAFEVTVSDSSSQKATHTYVGTVASSTAASFSIITSTIPTPTAGSSYGASIGVTGGTSPYTFTISSGLLPAGLTINSTSGLISGTVGYAAQGSSYLFSVKATDATGLISTVSYSGFVTSYSTSMVPSSLPGGTPGVAYNATVSTVGGQSPFTYSLTAGTLPSGLSLGASSGTISGTIAQSESGLTKNFTIKSTDANNIQTSTSYSITSTSYSVTITTASLSNAIESSSYTNGGVALAAAGGTGPYTYQYTGSLPTGVGLTSTGSFFGTPASGTGALAGGTTYTIYVTAKDSAGNSSAQVTLPLVVTVSVPVVDALTPTNATLGTAYSYTITASGGRSGYTFALSSGSLPTGVTLSTGGVLSGTPTAATTCPASQFNVTVTDTLSQTSAAVAKCITTVSGVNISNNSFPVVVIGTNYSSTVSATGGTAPYTFTSSGLPSGVSLNSSTGLLSGFTNASTGSYTGYITVTDSSTPTLSTTRSFAFSVKNPVTLTGGALPHGGAGISYNSGSGSQLSASGGQSPYTYAISSGSLPSGLSLSSSGLISGTPAYNTGANGGNYTVNIIATDSLSLTSSAATFTLGVTVPPKVTSTTMTMAVLNVPYVFDIKRSGGFNDFNGTNQNSRLTWTVTGLPAGLNYGSTTGRIYGTPTTNAASPYSITATVSDAYGFTGTGTLTLKIASAPPAMFDLKSPHFSDPCSGTAQCSPLANDIAQLTNNTAQFLVFSRTDTVPKSIQISKIDSTGRVPKSGLSNFSVNIPLRTQIGGFGFIKAVDMDQDGYKDIVFTDSVNKQVCILWNMGGTVDGYGMPNGFSANNLDCFAIPVGGNNNNVPSAMTIRSDLRPDSTNYGKQDVIVTMNTPSQGSATIFVLRNTCALNAACNNATTQRPVIFDSHLGMSATTTSGSTTVTVTSTTGILAGMTVAGAYIPVGTTVSSVTNGTTFVLSANASTTGTANITVVKGTAITASITSGSTTATTASTAGIFEGQLITNGNFPQGTRVVSIVTNTSITTSNASTGTGAGQTLTIFGPVSNTPQLLLSSSQYMQNLTYASAGWFVAARPNLPTTYATSANTCPGIVVGGYNASSTGQGYAYVMRQVWTGTQCLGDFQVHLITDELLVGTNTPNIAGIDAEDFNNDGITDIAVTMLTAQTSSASVKVYLPAGGATFSGGTTLSPQVQSLTTTAIGINRAYAYCIDGSTACSYPALLLTCSGSTSCLSILPNQCSTPGCTTPFEGSTPSLRIDYPAPSNITQDLMLRPLVSTSNVTPTGTTTNGSNTITSVSSIAGIQVGQTITGTNINTLTYVTAVAGSTITMSQNAIGSGTVTLTIPTVPTRNDIAMAGYDANGNAPYFVVFARNGSSTTDPLKGATSLNSFPAAYIQGTDTGMLKLYDANGDGKLDLFAFMSNQGFVNTYYSQTSGGVTYDLGSGPVPYYVANPSMAGCPSGANVCFPNPILSSMGVQQQFPNSYQNDNTMDIGDLNNDGNIDVIANGYYSRGVAVALGNSSGALGTPSLYEIGTSTDLRPVSVVLADLDQDGILDIALIGINVSGSQTGIAYWMKGNGDGTFQTPQNISQILNGCTDPRVISAVDIDLDGRPELAVLCYSNQQVWISRRNSSGTWVLQSGATLNTSGGGNGVTMKFGYLTTAAASGIDMAVGGLDGVNTVRSISNISLTVTNTTTGAFTVAGTASPYVTLYGYAASLDIADLNGDGYGDIVVPMTRTVGGSNNASAFYTLTTTSVGNYNVLGWGMDMYLPYTVAAGDVTGDGLPEIFIGYSNAPKLLLRTINRALNISQ